MAESKISVIDRARGALRWLVLSPQVRIGVYLALALALPALHVTQAPDTVEDYLPIRDHILAHPLTPSAWITENVAYRVPGYPLFLAVLALVSKSELWVRLVQGLLLVHMLWIGERWIRRLGGSPTVFAWAWTGSLVHFYFAQMVLSETLASWLTLAVFTMAVRPRATDSAATSADGNEGAVRRVVLGGLRSAGRGLTTFLLLWVKPAYAFAVPVLLWPWRKHWVGILLVVALVGAWGLALKPRAGKWIFMAAGGGLNLFIATLPDTFDHEGDDLDRYWLEEQHKVANPQQIGWYRYDAALKQAAIKRFPHWNLGFTRAWSMFFGTQYRRGFRFDLLPFGLVMLAGCLAALRFRLPLVSLFLGGVVATHYVMAPYARFLAPLSPLAAAVLAVELPRLWARWFARRGVALSS